jgi:hypothetical protein
VGSRLDMSLLPWMRLLSSVSRGRRWKVNGRGPRCGESCPQRVAGGGAPSLLLVAGLPVQHLSGTCPADLLQVKPLARCSGVQVFGIDPTGCPEVCSRTVLNRDSGKRRTDLEARVSKRDRRDAIACEGRAAPLAGRVLRCLRQRRLRGFGPPEELHRGSASAIL